MESFTTDSIQVDVAIVGAGPAGSAAAKRCAESGLETVLLEKKELPRDKVCSGMIIGQTAQKIIQAEFGGLPKKVLAYPYYYSGIMIHIPGVKPSCIEFRIPVGWRRDIDFWITQNAQRAGAQVWDRCRIKSVEAEKDQLTVKLLKDGKESSIKASYVIGADGVHSIVRRKIFLELKANYQHELREVYRGSFPLDRNYFHGFYIPGKFWFDINHKGPYYCLEVSAKPGELQKRADQAKKILHRHYDFDPETQPLHRDGCMEPRIHEELIRATFRPAKGRVLLAGDAAGFQLPTSEGIGTALLSGFMAGESIVEAIKGGGDVSERYLRKVQQIINTIEKQFTMAMKSRYGDSGDDLKKTASKIHSFFKESLFSF